MGPILDRLRHLISATERAAEGVWNHPAAFRVLYAVLALGVLGCGVLWVWPPPAGIGAVLLALAVIPATVWPRMHYTMKVLSVFLVLGLVSVELHAILADSSAREKQFRGILDQDRADTNDLLADNYNKTNALLTDSHDRFVATEGQFNSVIGSEKAIQSTAAQELKTATGALNNLNGAGAMPVVIFSPNSPVNDDQMQLYVWNIGRNPLTGVHLTIEDYNPTQLGESPGIGDGDKFDVGTVAPQFYRKNVHLFQTHLIRLADLQEAPFIGMRIYTPSEYEGENLMIHIETQAGAFAEIITIRRKIGGGTRTWEYRLAVFRKTLRCENGRLYSELKSIYGHWDYMNMWPVGGGLMLPGAFLTPEGSAELDRKVGRVPIQLDHPRCSPKPVPLISLVQPNGVRPNRR